VTYATPPLHQFLLVSLVSLTLSPHATFELCSFSLSRGNIGFQNAKGGHVTYATPLFVPIFKSFVEYPLPSNRMQNLRFVASVCREIIGGSQIKRKVTQPRSRPFCPFFIFCIASHQYGCKIWRLYLQHIQR